MPLQLKPLHIKTVILGAVVLLMLGFNIPQIFAMSGGSCTKVFLYPECDWSTNQVRDVYQNSCTGAYSYQNYHYQDGSCGYNSPTAIPSPASTVNNLGVTIVPVTPTESQSSSSVTPTLILANSSQPLSGTQLIKVIADAGAVVDLQLQTVSGQVGTIFLTRVKIPTSSPETTYSWDTTNAPNGIYKLYGTVYKDDDSPLMIGPLEVTVDNARTVQPVSPNKISPAPATTSSTVKLPEPPLTTLANVTFPSVFNPQTIPADSTTKVDKIENTKTSDNSLALTFSGKSLPNTIITILIYSTPIVVTVKTDDNGLWTYSLEKPLPPGNHLVYAVAPKPDGSKIRSEVAQFTIAPAYAASANGDSLLLASADENDSFRNFIIATLAVIAVGFLGLLIIYHFKKQTQDTPNI